MGAGADASASTPASHQEGPAGQADQPVREGQAISCTPFPVTDTE